MLHGMIEVRRIRDREVVAYKDSRLTSVQMQKDCKLEARRLSAVYGERFFVEVWAHYPSANNPDYEYHRAYVFQNGRLVSFVGW